MIISEIVVKIGDSSPFQSFRGWLEGEGREQ